MRTGSVGLRRPDFKFVVERVEDSIRREKGERATSVPDPEKVELPDLQSLWHKVEAKGMQNSSRWTKNMEIVYGSKHRLHLHLSGYSSEN